MKVLLDENLSHRLRRLLEPMHEAFTVQYMGWRGVENGELLAVAAGAGFDVVLTFDRGMQYEQHLAALPCSVIILRGSSNDFLATRALVPEILTLLETLPPRSLARVPASD